MSNLKEVRSYLFQVQAARRYAAVSGKRNGCYFSITLPCDWLTMTSDTTFKLPEDLKQHIAPLAEAAGKTAHAWMVEALERQAAMAEAREAFLRDAEASAAEMDAGGAVYAAEDVAAYLLSRAG